jgi:hypothetical protein
MTPRLAPRLAVGLGLCLGLLSAGVGKAQDTPSDVTAIATGAAADLQTAIVAMQAATGARDRVAALTQTIRAYELGLDAVREGLRQVTIRETALTLQFEAQRDQVARLIGVLESLPTDPGPLLLLHPAGPLGLAAAGARHQNGRPECPRGANTKYDMRHPSADSATRFATHPRYLAELTTRGDGLKVRIPPAVWRDRSRSC